MILKEDLAWWTLGPLLYFNFKRKSGGGINLSENERKIRKPGRPNDNKSYHGKCDVRLSAEEDSMLNTLAERNNVSRSEVVRKALRDFYKFNSED